MFESPSTISLSTVADDACALLPSIKLLVPDVKFDPAPVPARVLLFP